MKLTALGTGTLAPHPRRTSPAWWLEAGAARVLLDCGAGVLHRASTFDVPWPTATHVAITHFHVDHWGELPHLLFAMKHGTEPARTAPLTLVAPRGFHERLGGLARAFGDWVLGDELGYPLDIAEILPGASLPLAAGVTLEAVTVPHTDESLAYAVRHGDRRVVYTGDTGPSEALAEWAADCDLLVAEASLPADRALDVHLTPAQAGALAARARAGTLVLTHFYPPMDAVDPVAQAAAEFDGPITAARDGDTFAIED